MHYLKIKEDGNMLLVEEREAEVVNPEKYLVDLCPPPLAALPGFEAGQKLWLNPSRLVIGTPLKTLNIKTSRVFATSGTPTYLTPIFRTTEGSSSIVDASLFPPLVWTPPPTIGLWFFLLAPLTGPNWNWESMDTFVLAKYANKWYRLPLPNVFDDGRICMGACPKELLQNDTWTNIVNSRRNWFSQNQWNADLLTDDKQARINSLFRFSVSPTGLNWCPSASALEACLYPTVPANLAKVLEVL